MMYSLENLAALTGYTAGVYAFLSTLRRVNTNDYHPRQVERYSPVDVQGTVQEGYDGTVPLHQEIHKMNLE